MIRVVLDSNIYISALLFGGNPRHVLQLAEDCAFGVAFSPEIRSEVEETLLDKFRWSRIEVAMVADVLWPRARLVHPKRPVVDCSDPDDNRVLECALESSAHMIVTGDRHLLALDPWRGIPIVNAGAFLDHAPWRNRAQD
jgi:putative PIN family toxin of toxin-antitoxin system